MRDEFVDELRRLAARDPSVVLLTGDLGFAALEPFAEAHPDRFINVGVAEQNMLGIATGLAEAGFRPYVYSIATFATMRGYEFLRNGALLHDLPVRVVGMGAGLDYGHNGVTHYALEDVAIMRVQPSIAIVAPSDANQIRSAIRATADYDHPIYFRLCKSAAQIAELSGDFEMGTLETIGEGSEVLLIALGEMAAVALGAAEHLLRHGIDTTVAVVTSFNPSPVDQLAELLSDARLAVSIESHYLNGGLGSFAAEVIAERAPGVRLIRHGITEMPRGTTGSPSYLYGQHGLSVEAVVASVRMQCEGAEARVR